LEDENFKGRKQNIEELEKRLFQKNNLLLLANGRRGIGKITLTAKHFERQFEKYKHLAWTLAEISILDVLLVLGNKENLDSVFPT